MEENDPIIEALDKLKGMMMQRMLKSGEQPPEEPGEEISEDVPSADDMGSESMDEELSEEMPIEDEGPKSSVLKRYDFAGKPSAPPAVKKKFPVKRR